MEYFNSIHAVVVGEEGGTCPINIGAIHSFAEQSFKAVAEVNVPSSTIPTARR